MVDPRRPQGHQEVQGLPEPPGVLRHITKIDAQLLDDRAKFLNVLPTLTERNEVRDQEQSKMKKKKC